MSELQLTLLDKSIITVSTGVNFVDIAKSLLKKKSKKVIGALFNNELKDLRESVPSNGTVEFLLENDPRALEILRHSAAHVMAQAVQSLIPRVKFGIGPSIEDGYYYDFKVETPFSPEDLEKIEKEMADLIKKDQPFERREMNRLEAIRYFEEKGEKYKVELLKDLEAEVVSVFTQGDFIDLCRGPHVQSTGQIKSIKILSSASSYWRGDENNDVLQRIYGTAFFAQADLDAYLKLREQIKARDHRKLGKELDLFSVHEDVGAGLIFWHPKGGMIRHMIEEFWRSEHLRRSYDIVYTPHIARERIYEISGHLQNYAESMYAPLPIDNVPYRLKPMNCPGHIKIYQTKNRSYRDLPLRYCELGTVYRYERSGTLHGMLRVRGFTQDDAHIFCTPSQMADEVYGVIDLVDTLMTAFGYTYKIFLATRPEKYLGTDEEWEWATHALREALKRWGREYEIDEGGGVFYAPKIDIKLRDALGREWQGPTIQVDLNLPKRFKVTFIGEDNKEHEVIMIHRAVLGSMERFVGGLIEHFGGAFPAWIAPVQAIILPITDRFNVYADQIYKRLRECNFRVDLDKRSEKLGYKIREGQLQKIEYMIILGERELESNAISIRHRKHGDLGSMSIEDFILRLENEVKSKTNE